jgi:hypothetical protein
MPERLLMIRFASLTLYAAYDPVPLSSSRVCHRDVSNRYIETICRRLGGGKRGSGGSVVAGLTVVGFV